MTTRTQAGHSPRSRRDGRAHPVRSFELLESKLQAPVVRHGLVARTVLIERLLAAPGPGVVAVVAPAGYGKTTLLAQWAARQGRRVAWVSADGLDNDPAVLLTYLAVAVDRVERIPPSVFRALASPGAGVVMVASLVSAMTAMDQPVTVVLDHADAVTNPDCLDALGELALSMPAGSRLVIGSRDALGLPSARLRAQGGMVEIGAADLAMDDREAAALLEQAGLDLSGREIHDLVERTEGWPAGLYLAALAMLAGSSRRDVAFSFSGDDRYVGDFLRSEFLERVSPAEARFLTRCSILDRMCGPLCDATLSGSGSGLVLEQLESRNFLVVPLDRRREWYRYHQLFKELLYAELKRREPEMVGALHSRAAEWYEANGRREAAIEHAQAAGDADGVARLMLNVMQPVWASGRVDTALGWMDWLEDKTSVQHYAAVAAHASLLFALAGRPGAAERWAEGAEQTASPGALPDGNSVEATMAYMRALLCRKGLEEMRADALIAWDGLDARSPYRATMLHVQGVSYLLEGDPVRAEPILARAFDVAMAAGAAPFAPLVLAERSIAVSESSDWVTAGALSDRAYTMVQDGHFEQYWTSALVYAWAARMALHRGRIADAQQLVTRAAHLRPLLTYALPVVSAQALLELARSYLALGDHSGARAVLRQTHDIIQQRPGLGLIPKQAAELKAQLTTTHTAAVGASSLTAAELRLLPLLSTHLSLGEIGDRLYLSRNTVKTHASSVYRKFGVSSRSEAIERMHELGVFSAG